MTRIASIELFELDLPFRQPFRHAAAERARSTSLFARFVTDSGHHGHGETLPRPYVTGEERGRTFDLLRERILPRLLELEFSSFDEVHDFLARCDGKAPSAWVQPEVPRTAAWCLVDLALLDAFARAFDADLHGELAPAAPAGQSIGTWPDDLRYGLVVAGESSRRVMRTLLKARLYGIREAKVKVDGDSVDAVRLTRRVLGRAARLRVDSNMAWSYEEARNSMARMAQYGVECFEQPLPADQLDDMARLHARTGFGVMADESFHDAASLERLIDAAACTALNVRIAKCGGLVASLARCRRALEAGLVLQVGCQVGETSQLSAAQLLLVRLLGESVRYVEGCYGERLLRSDPVRPLLQFGYGGRPPPSPAGPGFGTEVDIDMIRHHSGRQAKLTASYNQVSEEKF